MSRVGWPSFKCQKGCEKVSNVPLYQAFPFDILKKTQTEKSRNARKKSITSKFRQLFYIDYKTATYMFQQKK